MTTEVEARAYYSRHGTPTPTVTQLTAGLSLVRDPQGMWLEFALKDGQSCRVHLDMIGPMHVESAIRRGIDKWQEEFAK